MVECCIEAPEEVRFLNVFGVSNNTGRFWSNEGVREAIGYEPQDDGILYLEEAKKIDWWKVPGEDRYRDETGYMGMDFIYMDGKPLNRPDGQETGRGRLRSADHDSDTVRDDRNPGMGSD